MSDFKRSKTIEKRFWQYVDKRGDDDCWEWTGAKSDGYGRMRISMTYGYAHRISYELHYGPIPDGMCVCHHCDNPSCVNPKHLFIGTIKDNNDDRDRKGRKVQVHGSAHGRSKLTESQVEEIRKRYTKGEKQQSLAITFGVSRPTVSLIVTGKRWRLVPPTDVTQPVTVRTSRLKRVSGKAA